MFSSFQSQKLQARMRSFSESISVTVTDQLIPSTRQKTIKSISHIEANKRKNLDPHRSSVHAV